MCCHDYETKAEMLGVDLDGECDEELVGECDYCGEPIRKGDMVIGLVAPNDESLVICADDEVPVKDLLDLLGIEYTVGEADRVITGLVREVVRRRVQKKVSGE